MPVTRRDVLWGLGGGLAGAALTPVPWKLLDDTAIWTQRRHALPVPPRGPVTFRASACTTFRWMVSMFWIAAARRRSKRFLREPR